MKSRSQVSDTKWVNSVAEESEAAQCDTRMDTMGMKSMALEPTLRSFRKSLSVVATSRQISGLTSLSMCSRPVQNVGQKLQHVEGGHLVQQLDPADEILAHVGVGMVDAALQHGNEALQIEHGRSRAQCP